MNASWIMPAISIALLVVGLALCAWSLFWDRPRGRWRCPKCWYDMAGAAGLVCPECGHDARREGRLRKTRRRWGWAAVGCVVMVAAYGVYAGQAVRARGWVAAVPTWALVRVVPTPPVADINEEHRLRTSALWSELERRRRDMGVWHERVLMRRLARAYGADLSAYVLTRGGEWEAGAPVWVQINPQWWMQGPTDRDLILWYSDDESSEVGKPIQSRNTFLSWFTAGWLETLDRIDPPGDVENLPLRIVLRERLWDGNESKFYERNDVWSAILALPTQFVEDAEQVVTAFESDVIASIVYTDMFASLTIDKNRRHAIVYVEADWDAIVQHVAEMEDAVLALAVEIERDGQLVATGAVGAMDINLTMRFLAAPFDGVTHMYYLDQVSERLFAPGVSGSVWTVRVRGDAKTALRCFDAKQYWKGEAELPLTRLRVTHEYERGEEPVEEQIDFEIPAR